MNTYIVLKLRVKQVTYESNIYLTRTQRPKLKENQLGNLPILLEIQQRALGLGESVSGVTYLPMRKQPKRCCIFLLKVTAALFSHSRKGTVGAW